MKTLALPTKSGFGVEWFNGKTMRDRKGNILKCKSCFESQSKEAVELKVKELKAQGFEVCEIYECIF